MGDSHRIAHDKESGLQRGMTAGAGPELSCLESERRQEGAASAVPVATLGMRPATPWLE
jgi:hypothetical protein